MVASIHGKVWGYGPRPLGIAVLNLQNAPPTKKNSRYQKWIAFDDVVCKNKIVQDCSYYKAGVALEIFDWGPRSGGLGTEVP